MSAERDIQGNPDPVPGGYPAVDTVIAGRKALKEIAIILARHQIQSLKRFYDEFDHDFMLPLLLGEIALHNIGVLDSGKLVEDRRGAGAFDCPLKPCNAYSIAAATGLPRETVRRKISRLVESGWIVKRHNGHLFVSSRALQHFGTLLNSRELPELLDTAEAVRRQLRGASRSAAP